MGWIFRLSFFSAFILLQTFDVQAYNGAAWANAETAEAVLKYFSDFLQYTQLFNSKQMDEIKDIGDTITILMDQMVLMKKTSSAIFQALDTAFASSIAKLIAQEDQGESLNRKKSAIFDGFKAALKYVAGTEDPAYLNEIRSLLSTFTDGLPINPDTSFSSQTATPDFAPSITNFSTTNVNVQDNLAPQQELKVPNSFMSYNETQIWSQKFLDKDKSFTSAASLSGGKSLDLENMQNSKLLNEADSSIAVTDAFDQFIVKSFETEHSEIFSPLTSDEFTGNLNLPQSTTDLRGSNAATGENIFHKHKALPKSVITPVGNNRQTYPQRFGQSSSTILLNGNNRILSSRNEDFNDQSPRRKTDVSELLKRNDFQKSNPSYDYESSVPKNVISPDVTNEGQMYPFSFGQIASAIVSDDTAILSSGVADLSYESQRTKKDETGLFIDSDYQNNNPSYDYEALAPKTVISLDSPKSFETEHSEIFSPLTSDEFTGNLNLPQSTTDLRGSNAATRKNIFHEQKALPKSVITSAGNNRQTYPQRFGQSSSTILLNDNNKILSSGNEDFNDQSPRRKTDGSELLTRNDFRKSNPSYDYESFVPKSVISADVTNEGQMYPFNFGQSSSAIFSDDTAILSSGVADLSYEPQRMKNDETGVFIDSDYQNNNPGYDYETLVPETAISLDYPNERYDYPLNFGQSSSSVTLNDTLLLSSVFEDLDDTSLRKKSNAKGPLPESDFQNKEPNYHPQSSAYSIFVDSLSDELYYSDTFYEMFESDINTEEAVSALISLSKSVSEYLGLNSIINKLEDAVYDHTSTLYPNGDALDYAVEFASAIAEILANNRIITVETAENEAYNFADAIELFIETSTKNKSVSFFSSSDVDTSNHEGAQVQQYGDFTDESEEENSSPISADRTTSKGLNPVPDVLSTASRLYSESAIERISSVISKISSMRQVNSDSLGLIASQLHRMISAKYPDLSACETLHEVFSEILSALIHIVNDNDDYPINDSYIDESAAIISNALKYLA